MYRKNPALSFFCIPAAWRHDEKALVNTEPCGADHSQLQSEQILWKEVPLLLV
jgi:hypothetical protein